MTLLGVTLDVVHGWVLALLPLAALPLLRPLASTIPFSWTGLLTVDPFSRWADRALRAIGVLAIASLVLAAAGLHRPAYEVERIGHGAHMVLLVDRSTSMDRPFAVRKIVDAAALSQRRPKGEVARELLSKFVAERRNDRFGMVVFSTFPIPVLRPTDHHEVVHASISAVTRDAGSPRPTSAPGWSRRSSISRTSRTRVRESSCWCRTARARSARRRGCASHTGCTDCGYRCTGSTSGPRAAP